MKLIILTIVPKRIEIAGSIANEWIEQAGFPEQYIGNILESFMDNPTMNITKKNKKDKKVIIALIKENCCLFLINCFINYIIVL